MHEQQGKMGSEKDKWEVFNKGKAFNPTGIEIKEMDNLKEEISEIISDIKEKNNGRTSN